MNKAFVREPDETDQRPCPRCGSLGVTVQQETLAAQLPADALRSLATTAFFCPFARCDVVYFDAFDRTVGTAALDHGVYPKDLNAPICGCFGLTRDDIESDIREGGAARVRALLEKARSPAAQCLTMSPSGQCCAAAVQQYFMKLYTAARRVAVADRQLLYVTAFVRALATGMMGVLLGVHLATLELSEQAIGEVIAAGLAGATVASLLATVFGDRHGRRRTLVELAMLGAAGGIAVAVASDVLVIAAATFVGMLNGMGRDRGASLILEQAMLPATTTDRERTRVFANYNVLQDAGHALGSLLAGLPTLLHATLETPTDTANRAGFGLYAALIGVSGLVYLRLSPAVEAPDRPWIALTPESRRILWRVSALFSLDALGGGFLTTALLSYFFFERFGADAGLIAVLFFLARLANAVSHIAAATLARRIGLVNTMVFTHIPSSLLLVTVAYAPNFPVAVVLFLLREGLVEMDVPTRQSYVMAVMRPEERTVASGVTHLVRMGCWAVTAWLAGYLMQGVSLMTPLVVGAAMKITYDIALYVAFRNVRPPEEIVSTPAG